MRTSRLAGTPDVVRHPYNWIEPTGMYPIATPERAICDMLTRFGYAETLDSLEEPVFFFMRFDGGGHEPSNRSTLSSTAAPT